MTGNLFVLMGISGCGKTTVGKLLSETTGLPFYDGDDFHPAENKEKMRIGEPLTDKDRLPWLRTLAEHMRVESGWRCDSGLLSIEKGVQRPFAQCRNPGSTCSIHLFERISDADRKPD